MCFQNLIFAQPDDAYIKKLTGNINQQWLSQLGNNVEAQNLQWKFLEVHGFKNTSEHARKQALLSQPWQFYAVDTLQNLAKAKQVELPHKFDKNRDYNAGWYVSNYHVNKIKDIKYVLKLNRIQMFSVVFVNGKRFQHHFGSYTPFELDISDALTDGDNVFAIFVYDQSASVDDGKLYNQISTARLEGFKKGKKYMSLLGGMDDVPLLEILEPANLNNIFVKTSTRNKTLEIEYEVASSSKISSKSELSFELLKWPNGEKVALDIPSEALKNLKNGINSLNVKWTDPKLWSPDHPNLYVLRTTLRNGKNTEVVDTRFGFREFWVEGKTFMLNGKPIRLRGESHYHPMRYGVDFHREVFKMHKELFGSNACRIHAFMPPGDIILGADEAGMLLIDQSAVWSVNGQFYAKGGDWLAKNLEKEFEEWVKRDRNSPSVVIWDVENEMLRFNFELHLPWISKLRGFVENFDKTRPLNYSGAGWFSDDQDMVSIHMQDHYTRIMNDWMAKGDKPLIMGEFWIGGRADQRLPNAPEYSSVNQRYLEEAKMYEENILEMRYKGVSGMMPFRISLLSLFSKPHSNDAYEFSPPNKLEVGKKPEAVLQKIKHALQPVSTFFWPRQDYMDAEGLFRRELVLCNDGEDEADLELSWQWENQKPTTKSWTLKPAEQRKIIVEDKAPANGGKIIAVARKNGKIVSSDTLMIAPIHPSKEKITKTIQVYKDEKLAELLVKSGFKAISNDAIPTVKDQVIWVIPEHANNRERFAIKNHILDYLNTGGVLLSLKQDQAPTWFPIKFQFWSAYLPHLHTYEKMGWKGLNKDLRFSKYATILAPTHPVFSGIENKALQGWDPVDGRVSDDVLVRPSNVNKYEQGNWIPLASGNIREHVSLAEISYGKGMLLACQLNVIENLENPQANRLFNDMLQYLSNRKPQVFNGKVAIGGNLNAMDVAKLTGASETDFEEIIPENQAVMLAFEGTSTDVIKDWANKGGKVIVLSDEVSKTFEGIGINSDKETNYVATKINNHPLLNGVSSANFSNQSKVINGYFTEIPKQAKVLLQGFVSESDFWKVAEAGPVMVGVPYGKGEIILSTLKIDTKATAAAREFLGLLLTNAGVKIPYIETTTDAIAIKKTVPIKINGQLDEWLEAMEDRLVSQYIHAQPVYLTSESRVEGPTAFDLNLSAINYFMWDDHALYLAGVVFSETKNVSLI
uniref:glycoside hydrolase family 2 TIM barrel-domain containing protein n=1 Tax=Mariniflexile sp. TaxID=1979402 RepID=UPI00404848D3